MKEEYPEENKIPQIGESFELPIKKFTEINVDLSVCSEKIDQIIITDKPKNMKPPKKHDVFHLNNVDISFGTLISLSFNDIKPKKYFITFNEFKSKLFELSIRKFIKLFLKDKFFEKILFEELLKIVKNGQEAILFKLKDIPVEAKKGNNPIFALNNNGGIFRNYWKSNPYLLLKFQNEEDFILTEDFLKEHVLNYKRKNEIKYSINYPSKDELDMALIHLLDIEKDFQTTIQNLDFDCQWLLLALISKHYLSPFSFQPNDLIKISERHSPTMISNVLTYIYKNIQLKKIPQGDFISKSIFIDVFTNVAENIKPTENIYQMEKKDSYYYHKELIILPYTIIVKFPDIVQMNRVHKYLDTNKRLMVKLKFKTSKRSEFFSGNNYLQDLLGKVLKSKIILGSFQLSFLGYSMSQMREDSCWSIANINPDKIFEHFGELKKVKDPVPVSKYASKAALIFSVSMSSIKLTHPPIYERDIIRNKLNFSEGIGKASKDIIKRCAKKIGNEPISAVQIRVAGDKGMLCLKNDLPSGTVILRDSMKKFESDDLNLEILRGTSYMKGYLNRAIILMLHTLGVNPEIFLKKQSQYLESLREKNSNDQELATLLKKELPQNNITSIFIDMLKYTNPFNNQLKEILLNNIFSRRLYELKTKARIYIPHSCRLLGVLDEEKVLGSEEVYVSFTHPDKPDSRQILSGKVFVTRDPCSHPGDIRMLKAVNKTELQYLNNVIVFSQEGERPKFNEMSNGDLDGDIYFICWDKEIFPKEIIPPAPVDQNQDTSQVKLEKKQSFTNDEKIDFFVKFLNSCDIGVVYNKWLICADRTPELANNPEALDLSKLQAIAVDFAKQGFGVTSDQLKKFIIDTYPDFMEKFNKDTYQSQSAVGILYRSLKNENYFKNSNGQGFRKREYINKKISETIELNVTLIVPGFFEVSSEVRRIYLEYLNEIRNIAKTYKLKSEVEIWSGFYLDNKKYSTKEEKLQRKMNVNKSFNHLKDVTKKKYEELKKSKSNSTGAFASASYFVTYGNKRNIETLFNSIISTIKKVDSQSNKLYVDYMRKLCNNKDFVKFFDNEDISNGNLIFEDIRNQDKLIMHAISFPWVIAYEELCNLMKIMNPMS